jgi:hypothetical protein
VEEGPLCIAQMKNHLQKIFPAADFYILVKKAHLAYSIRPVCGIKWLVVSEQGLVHPCRQPLSRILDIDCIWQLASLRQSGVWLCGQVEKIN